MEKLRNRPILFLWLLGLLLILTVSTVFTAFAQTGDETWTTPVNLSQSGAATAPILVTDADGTYHVFWQDTFAGFVYSRGDGNVWTVPEPLRLPFSEPAFTSLGSIEFISLYTPVLAFDGSNLLHGFWRDELGAMQYSRTTKADAFSSDSWTRPVQLATFAITQAVVVDGNGRIHLTYIRPQNTEEFPAGVYYRYSDNGGVSWTDSIALYESDYLRSITVDEARIQIVVTDEAKLTVAWDNPPLDTVFTVYSPDGGETWDTPVEVDKRNPEDAPDAVGPSNVNLAVKNGKAVHLTWWAGHGEDALKCTLYHQWSRNDGQSWQPKEVVFEDTRNCPDETQFIFSSDNLFFLLTAIREEVYLQLWDEVQWSKIELQGPLARFADPETYRQVAYGCLQAMPAPDNSLFVVGCGTSNGEDIWLLERPFGDLVDWSDRFSPTPVWRDPVVVANSQTKLNPPQMIVGADGRVHAFWSQSDSALNSGRIEDPIISTAGNGIYYARLTGEAWSPARQVLTSPVGNSEQPAVAAGLRESLFSVWSSGDPGGIYFSRVLADRASSVSEWIKPRLLPSPDSTASWPDIRVDAQGTIYVAYSLPFNENRGIYLTISSDDGNSWSEPVRVFDGNAAEWRMVGRPQLAMTTGDNLHILWTHETTSSGVGATSLVYARSKDGGQTWSEPEIVSEETIIWNGIIGIDEQELHRVWLSLNENRTALWSQYSLDGGLTWRTATRISDLANKNGPTTLILDPAHTPHLLQLMENSANQLILAEWVWDGERWQIQEEFDLGETAIDADAVTAVTAPDGTLGVMFASLLLDLESGQLQDTFYYTSRQLGGTPIPSLPLPTLTPIPQVTLADTPIPQKSPTPTATFSTTVDQNGGLQIGPFSSNNTLGGIVLGIIPAILLIGITFIVGLRVLRNK